MISAGRLPALRLIGTGEISAADDAEYWRVLRIADPALSLEKGESFLPDTASDLRMAWERWRAAIFEPYLAPALESAAGLAAGGKSREIRALDIALHDALPADEAARGSAAGRRVFESLKGVRGDRWLGKLQAWSAAGEMPAQFAVAYACRYAAFHLPGRWLLPTYLHWEWSAIASGNFPPQLPSVAAEALKIV